MEFITAGLSAASQSLTVLKQLRELDVSSDKAAFKAKMLDLQEAANDARSALLDAKEALRKKDEIIHELQQRLESATSGESCPVCRSGRMDVLKVVPHPTFGEVGIQEKHLNCSNPQCSHSERRVHDPMEILDKK